MRMRARGRGEGEGEGWDEEDGLLQPTLVEEKVIELRREEEK